MRGSKPAPRLFSVLAMILLNLCGCSNAVAAVLDVSGPLNGQRLSNISEYRLLPPGVNLSLERLRAQGDEGFLRPDVPVPNFGLSDQTLWVRWTVKNSSEKPVTWLLDTQLGLVSDITLFKPASDGSYRSVQTGVDFPSATRDFPADRFVFELQTPAQVEHTYYMRIRNQYVLRIPMQLWDATHYQQALLSHNQFFSFFFGVLIVQAFYNLLLFLMLRDLSYLWYVGLVGTILFGQSLVWGFAFQWLPEFLLPWATPLVYLNFCAIALFELLFVRQFLDLERRERWISTLISWAIIWYALLMAGVFFLPIETIASVSHISLLLTNFTVISLCAFLLRKYRAARFLLVGWLGLVVGGSIELLRNMGYLPVNDFTMKAFPVGVMVDALALSFALADRIRLLRQAKDSAQTKLTEGLLRARDELEERVEQRTRQLIDARQAAEDAISAKNCYLQLVSHDLRSPLTSLKMIHSLMEDQPERNLELLSHSGPLLDQVVEKIDTLSHIRQIDSAHRGDIKLQRVDLHELVAHRMLGHEAAARTKQIQLVNQVPGRSLLDAEPWLLGEVLDNLLANAIKFSDEDSVIRILGPCDEYSFAVLDQGQGIDPEVKQRLFRSRVQSQPGTHGEKGQGYGLMLCRDVIDAHDGRLWCDSTPGKGSCFMVRLPGQHQRKGDPELAAVTDRAATE